MTEKLKFPMDWPFICMILLVVLFYATGLLFIYKGWCIPPYPWQSGPACPVVEAARGGGTGVAAKGDRVLRAPSTAPLARAQPAPGAPGAGAQ